MSDEGIDSIQLGTSSRRPNSTVMMKPQNLPLSALGLALFCVAISAPSACLNAQEIDLGRIGGFNSLGNGVVKGGAPPKTLVDDNEQHALVLTIWDSDTSAKVTWKPLNGGAEQTTVIDGTAVRAFQIDGSFKIQALGDSNRQVKYDYVLLGLTKE